ncbi:BTAD domain-containing putative transcriptional regulator [Longispora sp. K20-0274]|uniref:AfsR/SARP family transcriptional regulator n=1 Tax=Longispora sp. K20-0274 TaxID=3088255 RepID=UPI00399AA089
MRFAILGPFEADIDGTPLMVSRRQERRLLIALLLHPGEVVATDRLLDLLWGDDLPDRARSSLHTMVSRLRAALAGPRPAATRAVPPPAAPVGSPAGGAVPARRSLILAGRGGYRLDIAPDLVDACRFRDLLARAAAEPAADRRCALLGAALDLWRGDLPEDLAVGGLFDALTTDRLRATEDWLAAGLDLGRHADLLPELTRLGVEHPANERLAALRMTALHRAGRTAEALTHYEDTRRRLPARPGPELRETYLSVLRDEPATTPAPARRAPAQLPADPAGFVGRAPQLHRLDELRDHPVLLVTGPAGVGKTALATRWARRIADAYPDGQLYLDLRGYDRPVPAAETLGRFLRALGVPADQVPGDPTEASAALRKRLAGTRTLLVLDNASSADQIGPLLPDAPGCLALVTSRDRLPDLDTVAGPSDPTGTAWAAASGGAAGVGTSGGVAGGRPPVGRLVLDVLGADEAEDLLAAIVGPDRLRAEPDATAGLAAACARLPLALRIAAAHLADRPDLTVAAQLAQLRASDTLAELAIDGDPQSAVRAAFDQSYASLEPAVRRMFRLTGLLAAPDFGVSSAAVLADVPESEAARLLDRLAGAHLIAERPDGRYTRHDLLLLYSRHRSTEDPDHAGARTRLYEWQAATAVAAARSAFANFVEPSFPVEPVQGFPDAASAFGWLDEEHVHLWRSVMEAGSHGRPELACVLAESLRIHVNKFMPANLLDVCEAHLAAARLTGSPIAEASALAGLGHAKRELGLLDDAVEHFYESAALLRQADDLAGEAETLITLGLMLRARGHMDECLTVFGRALTMHAELDKPVGVALTQGNISVVLIEQGRLTEAMDILEVATATLRKLDNPPYLGGVLRLSGQVLVLIGRADAAIDLLEESVSIYQDMTSWISAAWSRAHLAAAYADCGRFAEARGSIETALREIHPFGTMHRSRVLVLAGSVFLACGEEKAARAQFELGRDLGLVANTPYTVADALVGLAGLAEGEEARGYAEDALVITRRHGYDGLTARAEALLPD